MPEEPGLKPSDAVISFIETYCRAPEGINVGQPIRLEDWQKAKIQAVYDSPTRRVIDTLGRKNGKTTFASCLLLCHLSGPQAIVNSQIFSTAQSRDQASLVFNLAVKMIRMDPDLTKWVHIRDTVKSLVDTETGCYYKALSADHRTAYGLSPVMAFHDELGQVRGPRSELFDAIETATGAHAAPLSWIISTQAPTDADLLSILIDDAATGLDPKTKLFMAAADKDDDPFSPDTWAKANPALGGFLSLRSLEEAAERARRLPAFMNAFLNLHLNMRVAVQDHFLSSEIWRLNSAEPDLSVFEENPVWGGLDLSGRQALTALALVARDQNGVIHCLLRFWTPKQGIAERAKKDRVPYDLWVKQGHLLATPGATVNYEPVAEEIAALAAAYDIVSIGYDRWRIEDLKREMDEIGCRVTLNEFGQGYKDMAPAIDDLESLAVNGKLRHGGHPVLTFCASNCSVTSDAAGNRKLNKARSTGRIDGMVALAMAIRQMSLAEKPAKSVYESRGLLAF